MISLSDFFTIPPVGVSEVLEHTKPTPPEEIACGTPTAHHMAAGPEIRWPSDRKCAAAYPEVGMAAHSRPPVVA
jgi:hypothetical protein